jgi:hypothetical protein
MGSESAITSVFNTAAGTHLRDVWTFDRESETCLFMREDVRALTDDQDLRPFIDNERYGYITRLTYEALAHATYQYTVRGFDGFETFRTFLQTEDGEVVGVMASVDATTDVDYSALYEDLVGLAGYSHAEWNVGSDPGLVD